MTHTSWITKPHLLDAAGYKASSAKSCPFSQVYGHQLEHTLLVGGFNPSEKYESVGVIIPNIWKKNAPNHQPAYVGTNGSKIASLVLPNGIPENITAGYMLQCFWTHPVTTT